MIKYILLFSRQGKPRLQKFYTATHDKDKRKIFKEVCSLVLSRTGKKCQFIEYNGLKLVYRRYASLYFVCAIEAEDNELLSLETIHRYVEFLDAYFGSVCELDIIFNFEKAHWILDELIIGGEIQDTAIRQAVVSIERGDDMMQEDLEEGIPKVIADLLRWSTQELTLYLRIKIGIYQPILL